MSPTAMSAETKATMRANLELEITARKDKLVAMCDTQCASLRSRLERRVNRVPSTKRTETLIEILEPVAAPQKAVAAKKVKETPVPVPASNARRVRPAPKAAAPAPAPAPAPKPAAKAAPKAAQKIVRGVKRTSDEISVDDKENNAELTVPKKRAKAAPAPRAARNTRAASKKIDPPHVLSPKTNNARPAAATAARNRRPR